MFITFIITILVETAIGLISGIFTFLLIKSIIAYSDHSQAAKIDKIDSRGSINDEAQYLLSLNDSDNSDP
jgi:Na+/H+ antiporter NhaC